MLQRFWIVLRHLRCLLHEALETYRSLTFLLDKQCMTDSHGTHINDAIKTKKFHAFKLLCRIFEHGKNSNDTFIKPVEKTHFPRHPLGARSVIRSQIQQ
jgi:hypothetical protein